ncbi:HesA/MoeB/ThiF family protein [uncultured Methanobrevibacter sp.]|uniref:HesA/MoeB/ThiF family protein n=1 Tax=uncultured Methanobrevibacter sp. TaxID=253161 RepID=UPI0025D05E6E|nr:HesA/MoeB/ThiF family protein [uncultured Methanobrevibacter sp.]
MPERFINMGYWEIVSRQMSIVTKSQQERFKESKITVVGCGGIGGSAIEMLARMGIGKLTVIDKDYFDFSNLNRQLFSSTDVLREDKAKVVKDKLRLINPYIEVEAKIEEINENNISELKDSDIIIDALDNLVTRVILSRFAKENNIPLIHGAINGTLGQMTVFDKESTKSYEELFAIPSKGKELTDDVKKEIKSLTYGVPPVIGPVPNIIGNLQAFEAFKYITDIGTITRAPKLLSYDLLNLNSFNIVEL